MRGSKSATQRGMRELLSSLDRGVVPATGKILIRDWLNRWIEERIIPHCRQSTRERNAAIIRQDLKPLIGSVEVGKLTPDHVQALASDLVARGFQPRLHTWCKACCPALRATR